VSLLTIKFESKNVLQGSNLIIVGIAFAALLNGAIALVATVSRNQEIRALSFWSSGTLSFARGETVLVLAIIAGVVALTIPWLIKRLDLFVFNPIQLTLLGYSPTRLRLFALTVISLAVAATVVTVGAVAFLGLAAPFIARFIFGQSMKSALLGAGLIGSVILLFADTLARSIAAPNELPISVVTSLIGAPFLLLLVIGKRGRQHA
jgi:iron complex transport system permease protein